MRRVSLVQPQEDLAALLAVPDNQKALRQATTNDLLTPLHLACYLGRADIVQRVGGVAAEQPFRFQRERRAGQDSVGGCVLHGPKGLHFVTFSVICQWWRPSRR
jgi:hypothetical protein